MNEKRVRRNNVERQILHFALSTETYSLFFCTFYRHSLSRAFSRIPLLLLRKRVCSSFYVDFDNISLVCSSSAKTNWIFFSFVFCVRVLDIQESIRSIRLRHMMPCAPKLFIIDCLIQLGKNDENWIP